MARQYARAGTHNGRARGTVKAVSTVNWGGRGIQLRRVEIRTRGTFRSFVRLLVDSTVSMNYRIVQEDFSLIWFAPKFPRSKEKNLKRANYLVKLDIQPLSTFRESEQRREKRSEAILARGARKGADSWQEIPGDRKPDRCLWGPRRRPLSVNGAESSPSRRGGGREMDARIVLAWQRDAGTPSPRFCFHAAARGRRLSIQMRWAYAMLIFRSAAKR